MINTSKYFHTYVLYLNNKKIVNASDSLNNITGKSNIMIILKNMLDVLKLCTNIVSINKLLQELNFKIAFNSFHCDLQD